MHLKRVIKKFIIFLLLPLVFTLLYLLSAFIFTFFPTKRFNPMQKKTEEIHILYNEAHTDIVIEITQQNHNKWNRLLSPLKQHKVGYLAFGWGDRETYLNTPTWSNLKISTAIKALFINTPSLMHVNYYQNIRIFKDIKPIKVSKQQLQQLEKSILESFNFKDKRHYTAYTNNDLFYPSHYQYNLFNTCNTWTGDRLRDANISMSYWTPFSQNVISSLP